METDLFHRWVPVHFFSSGRLTSWGTLCNACVLERDRFGGGSVMVWGGISHGLKSPLIVISGNLTGVRYRDEILRSVAVPFVQQPGLYRGQSSGLMLWLARKSWQTLATWGLALSCWKIRWCCCTNGTATDRRISSVNISLLKRSHSYKIMNIYPNIYFECYVSWYNWNK
jgi:hypothetical protein